MTALFYQCDSRNEPQNQLYRSANRACVTDQTRVNTAPPMANSRPCVHCPAHSVAEASFPVLHCSFQPAARQDHLDLERQDDAIQGCYQIL